MPVELIIIVFITLIALCMMGPQWYLMVSFAGIAALAAVRRRHRSGFTETATTPTPAAPDLDSGADLDRLLDDVAVTNGDDLLLAAMRNVAEKPKEAILARARQSSAAARKYFQEELDQAEQQHWWEDDSLVSATVKDGIHYE